MAYRLKEITMRTDNSPEGMASINELWDDIASGSLPLLFSSSHEFQPGLSPVSRYSNYSSDENGDYDLTIMTADPTFFQKMEEKVISGHYRKYDESDGDGDITACTVRAWEKVWSDQKSGFIHRTYTEDYESTVPAEYTGDGKSHCYLYIAVFAGPA